VVVRSGDTLIGRYTGRSTQQTQCKFLTNSQSVKVYFYLGKNEFYTTPHPTVSDTTSGLYEISSLRPNSQDAYYREFAPINVGLYVNAQRYITGFQDRQIQLQSNARIVGLFNHKQGSKSGEPCKIIALNRYFVNLGNGIIKNGYSWIKELGIEKCCESDLRIVDPWVVYTSVNSIKTSGTEFIKQKKIALNNYNPQQFLPIETALPY
jgi:hypothetical protein